MKGIRVRLPNQNPNPAKYAVENLRLSLSSNRQSNGGFFARPSDCQPQKKHDRPTSSALIPRYESGKMNTRRYNPRRMGRHQSYYQKQISIPNHQSIVLATFCHASSQNYLRIEENSHANDKEKRTLFQRLRQKRHRFVQRMLELTHLTEDPNTMMNDINQKDFFFKQKKKEYRLLLSELTTFRTQSMTLTMELASKLYTSLPNAMISFTKDEL
jgi:hypothetical protein